MTKIPENMVKLDERKIMKQGSSMCISIPTSVLKNAGVDKGDDVSLYTDGKTLLMIDLKPKKR